MMLGITVPTCSIASDGAASFVNYFTDGRSHPATFNANDRSRIDLYFLLLCGIITNGGISKFDGGSSHLTMVSNPCADFSCASTWIYEIESSYNDD